MEFRNFGSSKTGSDGNLVSVPTSRADLFSSKRVSVIEKRKMMNFLSKALTPDSCENEKYENFDAYLDKFKLTDKLKHFISASILFKNSKLVDFEEGKSKLTKFLKSLGRYSASNAFLVPLYGTGELSQVVII